MFLIDKASRVFCSKVFSNRFVLVVAVLISGS